MVQNTERNPLIRIIRMIKLINGYLNGLELLEWWIRMISKTIF